MSRAQINQIYPSTQDVFNFILMFPSTTCFCTQNGLAESFVLENDGLLRYPGNHPFGETHVVSKIHV